MAMKRSRVACVACGLMGIAALALAGWTFAPSPTVALPVAFVLGFAYFGSTTAMSSVLQLHLDQRRRAPVMALWFMSFGGTVPFGAIWGGWAMDHWSVRGTLLIGVAWLVVLAIVARDLPTRSERWKEQHAMEGPNPEAGLENAQA